MKKIYNEYKENVKYFFKNKTYIITIILIAILCYGFYITNFSLGVDDFSQDRYITGTYLLSQGRWGNVLLGRLFNITTFVPFWTEFISILILVFTAIILSAFIKKEIGHIVDKTVYYCLFSGILISYPLIHHIFLYNFANIITGITTLAVVFLAIIIYENTFHIKNKNIFFVLTLIMPFVISMYEAGCQTFITLIFIISFINLVKNKKFDKNIIKYIINSVLILITAIILNALINVIIKSILVAKGTLTPDFSTRSMPWLNYDLSTCFKMLNTNVIKKFLIDIKNVDYIAIFFVVAFLTIIISTIETIRKKNIGYLILNIIIILSNFMISVMQTYIVYRTNTSWSIVIAFMILYILAYTRKKEVIRNLVIIITTFIILYNSKNLTFAFYNDIVKYEREKNIAYDIANTIIRTCENPYKPIVYIAYDKGNIQGNSINLDNGWSVIGWGYNAFGQRGVETTKFINSLGYNFTVASNEEWEQGYTEFMEIKDNYEKDYVIELEKYIIVKIIYEPR